MGKINFEQEHIKLTERIMDCIDDFVDYCGFVNESIDDDKSIVKVPPGVFNVVEMSLIAANVNYYVKMYRSFLLNTEKNPPKSPEDILHEAVNENHEVLLTFLDKIFKEHDINELPADAFFTFQPEEQLY